MNESMSNSKTIESNESMTNSKTIESIKPLPREIMDMHISETACQYCGISYLLLNKYERMQALVNEMEAERTELREFIDQRPTLLKKLTSLQDREKELNDIVSLERDKIADLEKLNFNFKADFNVMAKKHAKDINQEKRNAKIIMEKCAASMRDFKKVVAKMRFELVSSKRAINDRLKVELPEIVALEILKLRDGMKRHYTNLTELKLKQQAQEFKNTCQEYESKISMLDERVLEFKNKARRLETALLSQKTESEVIFQNQKVESAEFQRKCTQLETDLSKAESEIMESSRIMRIQKEKIAAFKREKDDFPKKIDNYEKQILDLKCSISRIENLHQQEINKNTIAEQNSIAITEANASLLKKNLHIQELEKAVFELGTDLNEAKKERIQTIEAHQSRIGQLQEKYLKEKNESLQIGKEMIEKEITEKIWAKYMIEINDLKTQHEKLAAKTKKLFEKERGYLGSKVIEANQTLELEQRNRVTLENRIENLKDSAEKEREQLLVVIEKLQESLKRAQANADPNSVITQERGTMLQCALIKKDNEISFLKETVRVECEERMGLVALLAKQRETPPSAPPSKTLEPKEPSSRPISAGLGKPKNTVKSPPLSSRDADFFKMIKMANAKNAKRLAKQSRSSLSNY